jgi:hypothetical protein
MADSQLRLELRIRRDFPDPGSSARSGYVTRFRVRSDFLARYPVQQVGGSTILELWVPASDLDEFNANIVGKIDVVYEFTKDSHRPGRQQPSDP